MPTVEFDYRDVIDFLGKKYSPEELRKAVPMLGVDLESVDEEKLEVEIFPNRPDMLSVEGFSRALAGFLDLETGYRRYSLNESDTVVKVDSSVNEVRPYISAAEVKGLKLDERAMVSLMNLQEKLHVTHGRNRQKVAIGVHDSQDIEPPYTYRAVKPDNEDYKFVPLDMDSEMTPFEILEKHPKGREYSHILEDKDRCPLILDDKNQVLSFPPIINGNLTRISESTENVFIDVTGTDEKAVDKALNILLASLADRGAELFSVELSYI